MNPGTQDTEQVVDDIKVDDISMGRSSEDNSNSDASQSDDSDTGSEEQGSTDQGTADDTGGENSNSDDDSNPDVDQSDATGDDTGNAAADDAGGGSDDGDDLSEVESFNALSEETGVEVSTDEDIVSSLKELATLRQGGDDNSKLSPAILEAIKVEKNGGNLADHFARTGMDFDKMDGRDVLRQQFFKAEAKLYNSNPKFAQMRFERDFNSKFGKMIAYNALSNQDDKDAFAEENGGMENIEYEKMMFETETTMAKSELNEWKESAAPVVQDQSHPGMTQEESDKYATAYREQVKQSWSGFESVSIEMGEGLNDFSLGLTETTKPRVEGWMNNPATFLSDIGFDGQKIDTDRLLPIMTAIAELSEGTLGSRLAKYVVNADNIETFKKQIDKPIQSSSAAPSKGGVQDDWDKIAEAAEKAAEEYENSRR